MGADHSTQLRSRAEGWRNSVALNPMPVPVFPADPAVDHVTVHTPSGDMIIGSGMSPDDATHEALLTACARRGVDHLALLATVESSPDEARLGEESPHWLRMFNVADNTPMWVPAHLALPDDSHLTVGIAAHHDMTRALLRAIQDLVAHDAAYSAWLHQTPLPRGQVPAALTKDVARFELTIMDATPVYSPHPVAIVAGVAPMAGRARYAVGIGGRSTWEEAVAVAYQQWARAVVAIWPIVASDTPERTSEPEFVRRFDDHLCHFTRNPAGWDTLPWWPQRNTERSYPSTAPDDADALASLVEAVSEAGIQLYYRDTTSSESMGCGLRCVRMISPQLLRINCDHRHTPDVSAHPIERRFPHTPSGFPSPHPHPFGRS